MTFLQPLLLWLLPLCLIPVIIHFLNRLRYRTVNWAAIMFLVNASRYSTNMAKLRQFLILLFRILAILLLLLAISRPLAGGWLGWSISGTPDTVIILLDRSLSMSTEYQTRATRLEHAMEILLASAKAIGSGPRFILIENVNMSPIDLADINALPKIPSSSETDTAADIPSMLSKALEYINTNKTGTTEIWIVSDLQKSNWQPENSGWQDIENKFKALPQTVRFRLLALDSKSNDNAAVRITRAPDRGRSTTGMCEVDFEIIRPSPEEITMPITIAIGENKRQMNFKISGTSARIKHMIKPDTELSEGVSCHIEIPADSNKKDNTAFFSFSAPPPMNAAIVSASNSLSAGILQLAATSILPKSSSVKNYSPENADLIDFDSTSLILWLADLPDEKVRNNIIRFIEGGGSVIFFPPLSDNTGSEFSGISWAQMETTKTEADFHISEWDRKSGPLEDSYSGTSLPLLDLKITLRRTASGKNLVPCAYFSDRKSLLSRLGIGKGSAYFCSTLPESKWSTLKEGKILVPLVYRLAEDGAARNSGIIFSNCGVWRNDEGGRELMNIAGGTEKTDGSSAGIFRANGKSVILNFPVSETDFESLTADEIKTLFREIPISLFHEKSGKNVNIQAEIWKGLLLAMLVFMIAESLLCLPSEIKLKTGKHF